MNTRGLPRAARWLACGLAFWSAGCARKPAADDADQLARVKLPGFSIELPAGTVVTTADSPAVGKHEIRLPEPSLFEQLVKQKLKNGTLSISWSAQSYTHAEWKQTMLPLFIDSIVSTIKDPKLLREEMLTEHSWIDVIGSERIPIGYAVIVCDPDFSVMIVYAQYQDSARQAAALRRIAGTVQCAVMAENRLRPRAAMRLPGKFGVTQQRDFQMFRSLDGEQLLVNFTTGDVQNDPKIYFKVVRAMIASTMNVGSAKWDLAELAGSGAPLPHKSSLMRADFPATREHLYVMTQYCSTQKFSLIGFWFAPDASDPLARERQAQIGCPGDVETPVPPFEVMVDAACTAGAHRACTLKRESN